MSNNEMNNELSGKVLLHLELTPGENGKVHENATFEGRCDDLCAGYAAMTIRLLEVIESNCEPGFAPEFYAMAQRMIAENSCLKDSIQVFAVGEDTAKRFAPLLGILGKTFTMPEKESEEE